MRRFDCLLHDILCEQFNATKHREAMSDTSLQLSKGNQSEWKATQRVLSKLIRLVIETGTITGPPSLRIYHLVLTFRNHSCCGYRQSHPFRPPRQAYLLSNCVGCSGQVILEHDDGRLQ